MNRRGFTLIELLIAVGIIAFLAAMAMPLLTLASRQAKRGNTEVTLRKLDAAIRMFRTDVDVLPYQLDYPTTVAPGSPFPNRLAARLARTMTPVALQDLQAVVAVAAGKYGYPEDVRNSAAVETATLPSPLAFRIAYMPPSSHWDGWDTYGGTIPEKFRRYCSVLNRVAQRRAVDAVHAGALDLKGGIISGPRSGGIIQADLSAIPLLSPAERGSIDTGWCDDYLQGELAAGDIAADAVLDAWKNPLILVCQVVPGAKALQTRFSQRNFGDSGTYMQSVYRIDQPSVWGLGMLGFATATGPWADVVASKRYVLLGSGRIQLSSADAGDGKPVDAQAQFLPSVSDLRGSDRRYYAAPGLQAQHELWSAGPDGMLVWMRSERANADNVSAGQYDRGLP